MESKMCHLRTFSISAGVGNKIKIKKKIDGLKEVFWHRNISFSQRFLQLRCIHMIKTLHAINIKDFCFVVKIQ